MRRTSIYPIIQALLAAVLFGASAPLAKLLLDEIAPVPLAAFLYLGSGIGLTVYRSLRRASPHSAAAEAQIGQADLPWIFGAVLSGGVIAPIVLMFSLRATPAATASLLLNFEGVATAMIAAWVFKEALGRRVWWAVALITLASVILTWDASEGWGISWGAIGVLGACALWGLDNNLTRNVSAKDPSLTVTIKGLGAGGFSLLLALALRNPFPQWTTILAAMLLGSVSYGLGIVLFILALRGLGAARTGALYGTAPFVGAFLSFILFRDQVLPSFVVAFVIMTVGAALLLREEHTHSHTHPSLQHTHRHRHDDGHHAHQHAGEVAPDVSHAHEHNHEATEHVHPHMPDIHHRHAHRRE